MIILKYGLVNYQNCYYKIKYKNENIILNNIILA